jgi:hypothetical protein
MIHPKTTLKFISPEIGFGVVATEFIPKGTITWIHDNFDQEFTPEQVSKMDGIYQDIIDTYSFRNNKGNLVLCWDNSRFVNHSFNSNCFSTAYDFEIAIRDIHPGEELTDDYGYLNVPYPFKALDEGTKRKTVYPDDLLRYHKVWDKKIAQAFVHIEDVEQPLGVLLTAAQRDQVARIVSGDELMTSILSCYYSDQKVETPVQAPLIRLERRKKKSATANI